MRMAGPMMKMEAERSQLMKAEVERSKLMKTNLTRSQTLKAKLKARRKVMLLPKKVRYPTRASVLTRKVTVFTTTMLRM